MKVRMKATISGTRDGQPWPARGGVLDLPAEEAEHLIAAGLAEDAKDSESSSAPAEETATPKATAETATPKRGRSAK
ncbi:DUF7302 family protein [Streptomyces hygroscopicus]|uniref:DUF7302 family protein n=1 Tax=Streptomyces hygroscopicus TaxID=1912 RepID=UPI000767C870|nr:hypothetical protein [Streptomyces hygroscopicus]